MVVMEKGKPRTLVLDIARLIKGNKITKDELKKQAQKQATKLIERAPPAVQNTLNDLGKKLFH